MVHGASSCCCDYEEYYCYEPSSFWTLSGEFLYWQTLQDSLDIAGKGSVTPGNIKHIEYDWAPGFRVATGGIFCERWGFELRYTYLRPKGSRRVSGEEIFPVALSQFVASGFQSSGFDIGETIFQKVRSKARFDLNIVDLPLFFRAVDSDCLTLAFVTGFQGAFLREKISSNWEGNLFIDFNFAESEFLPFILSEEDRWRFDGGGFKFGAQGEVYLGCGFLFQSSAEFNLLLGRYKNRYNQTPISVEESTLAPGYNTLFEEFYTVSGREKFCDFTGNVQMQLALGYENQCGCVDYCLKAGWEMMYWYDLAQSRRGLTGKANFESPTVLFDYTSAGTNATTKNSSSVGFHGLVISLDLRF